MLDDNGELIFIVPSDFTKLTSSTGIISKMYEAGTFTHIIHPHKERLFKNASIDVIIFRYCKNADLPKKVLLNDEEKCLINTNGILTYSDTEPNNLEMLQDYFNVFVGMVTGKERVFKNVEFGNIRVLNNKDKEEKYILIENFPTNNQNLNEYMLSHKDELIARKIRKFNEQNWFEWGALRNYKNIISNIGKNCVYVSNITRKEKVAFIGKVQYFGGGLIMMIPKADIDLDKVVNYLNSGVFKKNYMYSGRFKIGHKQLCNALYNIL